MKLLLIISLMASTIAIPIYAQDEQVPENEIKLDILQPPSSPGASLIGVAPQEIQKPVEPKAFVTSLQNATNNFSSLPASFAVDITPAWFFGGRNIDYEDFSSNRIDKNLYQSFTLSSAFKNDNAENDTIGNTRRTQLGLAFKVSLLRGKIIDEVNTKLKQSENLLSVTLRKTITFTDSAKAAQIIDSLQRANNISLAGELETLVTIIKTNNTAVKAMQDSMRNLAMNGLTTDSSFIKLQQASQRLLAQNDSISLYATRQVYAGTIAQLQKLAQEIKDTKYKRYGWKLDAAGGWAIDFPGQVFDYAQVNRFGIWLIGGYELQKNFSFLGLLRYYHNPDKVLADDNGILKNKTVNTLDWGGRLLYHTNDSKASFSGEILYRSVTGKQESTAKVDPSWRFTINAEYEILPNTRLTVAIGRDFDGLITREGNIIGFLNLITSFGGDKRTLVANK